jgi:hypothetical protein
MGAGREGGRSSRLSCQVPIGAEPLNHCPIKIGSASQRRAIEDLDWAVICSVVPAVPGGCAGSRTRIGPLGIPSRLGSHLATSSPPWAEPLRPAERRAPLATPLQLECSATCGLHRPSIGGSPPLVGALYFGDGRTPRERRRPRGDERNGSAHSGELCRDARSEMAWGAQWPDASPRASAAPPRTTCGPMRVREPAEPHGAARTMSPMRVRERAEPHGAAHRLRGRSGSGPTSVLRPDRFPRGGERAAPAPRP